VLEGFTIANTSGVGTGISCGAWGNPSSPTISRCIFHGHDVGLRVNTGAPTVTNCLFHSNRTAIVTSCQAPAAWFELVNCTVTNNSNLGVYHGASTLASLNNCIVWGNVDDVEVLSAAMLYVGSSDIPGYPLYGNIDEDPQFTDSTYRLSYDSPCVDSGFDGCVDTAYDLGGLPRIFGARVDMGAYEMCGPPKAINPSPIDDAIDVVLCPVLSWSDGGGATSYDVYLGTSSSPGPGDFMGNQSGTSFQIDLSDVLEPNTTYYWRIDPRNSYGPTTGDVWRFSTASGPGPSTPTVYVNAAATGLNNGESWKDAFTRLQDALFEYHDHVDVWVAAGTYKPDQDAANPNGSGDRTASFALAHSWYLYGGFAGCETEINQRNPAVNVTILSGDLAGDDGPNFANNGENSYHVVTEDTVWTALVGFTVTGGNANGGGAYDNGGGMLIENSDPAKRVDVVDCIFIGNSASNPGGGIYNVNGSPFVTNCVFSGNNAYNGGGMFNHSGSPFVTNCVFSRNSAAWGGGMLNSSGSPSFTNCTFRHQRRHSFLHQLHVRRE